MQVRYSPLGRSPFTFSKRIRDETLSAMVQIESGGNWQAKAPTSSATGLLQFLNATWLDTIKKHRPDILQLGSQAEILALRKDPFLSLELGARLIEDSLSYIGSSATDGDLYLAHFSGPGVARQLMRVDQATRAEQVYSDAAVRANRSILEGKTVAQVRAWANGKMRKAKEARNWVEYYADLLRKSLGTAIEEVPEPPLPDPVPLPRPDPRPAPLPPVVEPAKPDAASKLDDDKPSGDPIIWHAQKRLKARGYHEIGICDGKIDGRTIGAISAFRADRGLPPSNGGGYIDAVLYTALDQAEAEGWMRPISVTRQTIQEKDLTPKVEAAQESWFSRQWAKVMAIIGGGAIGGDAVADYFDTLRSWYTPVRNLVAAMPWQLWVGIFVIVFLIIWRSQRKASASITTMAQQGKLTP